MGPMGQGPMTGGGRGYCGGATRRMDAPQRGIGLGLGRGPGNGGGWRHRHWFFVTGLTGWQRAQMGWQGLGAGFPMAVSKEQELAELKQAAQCIEQTLGELKSRIQKLDTSAPAAREEEHE